MLWLFLVFIKPLLFKEDNNSGTEQQAVSVIVVAKNEKENLEKLLPQILNQNHPNFELIVVDDHSWDGTYEYLHELKTKHANFDLIGLGDFVHAKPGKKLSITLAIKKAKNDILLFTDADCIIESNEWITEMTKPYEEGVDIVIGYSPYSKTRGLLNPFVRFEAFWVAWQYFSLALAGMPYMGVGRDLSYRKSKFLANKGFASNLKVAFGDDDLLIQDLATAKNTRVVLNTKAFVESNPKKESGAWLKQKRRHLSAGKYYKPKFKFFLGALWFSRFVYYLFIAAYFVWATLSLTSILLLFLPLLLYWLFAFLVDRKLHMFNLWWAFPVLDILYQTLIYPLFGLVATISPQKNKWS